VRIFYLIKHSVNPANELMDMHRLRVCRSKNYLASMILLKGKKVGDFLLSIISLVIGVQDVVQSKPKRPIYQTDPFGVHGMVTRFFCLYIIKV
jgi:hypothetical protein